MWSYSSRQKTLLFPLPSVPFVCLQNGAGVDCKLPPSVPFYSFPAVLWARQQALYCGMHYLTCRVGYPTIAYSRSSHSSGDAAWWDAGLLITFSLVLSKCLYKPNFVQKHTKLILSTHAFLLMMDKGLPTFIVLSIMFYLWQCSKSKQETKKYPCRQIQDSQAFLSA